MARTLEEHLFATGPKRILSLDGGGVRGLITLGMLKRVEWILASRSHDPKSFRLSDYFDLIGGASTGAIIATLLAFGKRVDEITDLYFRLCPRVFSRRTLLSYLFLKPKFDTKGFTVIMEETFDEVLVELGRGDLLQHQKALHEEPTLGTDLLKTGLALVTKRIDTASVWALTNNPRAKFWDPEQPDWADVYRREGTGTFHSNRNYSLRRLVRASASAPFFLDAVEVAIADGQAGLFLDGGASPFNNPAQELFLMTTLKARGEGGNGRGLSPYGFGWAQGEHELFMLSLGTGAWSERRKHRAYTRQNEVLKAIDALRSIISDTEKSTVTWLQALSASRVGTVIDGCLADMRGLHLTPEPLLTFRRLSPRLETEWLEGELGAQFKPSAGQLGRMREFDVAARSNLELLHKIGIAAGAKLLADEDFPGSFDLGGATQTHQRPLAIA